MSVQGLVITSEAVAAFLVRLLPSNPVSLFADIRHLIQPLVTLCHLMAGYELPVTRVPGLGSMDQIGAALGAGPATDYLGSIITCHQ